MNKEERWFDWSLLVEDLAERLSSDADCYRKLGMTADSNKIAEELETVADHLSNAVEADQRDMDIYEKDRLIRQELAAAFDMMKDRLIDWWD